MPTCRSLSGAIAALLALAVSVSVPAQSVTTGAIAGSVTDNEGRPLAGARVSVSNPSTGFSTTALTRDGGSFLVQGLEVGGPYRVTARRLGFRPRESGDVFITLSETRRVDFRLAEQIARLSPIAVTAAFTEMEPTNAGTKSSVSDTLLQRLPSLERSLTDFIRLAPQVAQSGAGYSAGGMSNRMNNVQIDGASERDVYGLGATGQPGARSNARSISIAAVKELQVILAPFDVRHGNFGGLLLNAVSKAGTNDMRGSAFYFYRDEGYGRNVSQLRATRFERRQYGFTLGGPIVRDRLHFFIAPEFRDEFSPIGGPYLGQPASSPTPLRVAESDIVRFEAILRNRYGTEPGTAGPVEIPNPADNVFARLDFRINDVHRMVFRYNHGFSRLLRLFPDRTSGRVAFSSNFHNLTSVKNAPVVQLFSSWENGSYNEFFLGYNQVRDRRTPPAVFPQVTVLVPLAGGGTGTIIGGADQFSQGNELDQETFELTDNFSRAIGNHTLTVGTRQELVRIRDQFNQSSYGVWTFRGLDSLDAGNANSFRRAIILKGDGSVRFSALQSAFYAQSQWRASPDLNLALGLRLDVSSMLGAIAHSAPIFSAYGSSTSDLPGRAYQWSPRFGFNWDVRGAGVDQLRGGIGAFVGAPPYVWLENAYRNSGQIITFLNCNTSGSTDPAPAFSVDPTVHTACRNGAGSNPIGAVSFLAGDLRFPQPLRATLAYDRLLPGDVTLTFEGLYSRTLNQFFFRNINLIPAARGVDARGRMLYGDTILVSGASRTSLPPRVIAAGGASRFAAATDIVNHGRDYAFSITAQLKRRYVDNWEGMIAYAYGRARDVQSFTPRTDISTWGLSRTHAGDMYAPSVGTSFFDQPHRLVAAGTYTLRWRRGAATDLSFFYQGVSGAPHDYVYGGFAGAGDLNADGFQGNDLIYVPRDARDPAEIRFLPSGSVTADQQAEAFEQFIRSSPCLNRQRGRILRRNSCRLPFSHVVDVAVRQSLPELRGQRVAVQLDVFNFGNLLNGNFGKQRVSPFGAFNNVELLTHVGQSGPDPKVAVPIVQFNTQALREYVDGDFTSNFWRAQLSLRYSF